MSEKRKIVQIAAVPASKKNLETLYLLYSTGEVYYTEWKENVYTWNKLREPEEEATP